MIRSGFLSMLMLLGGTGCVTSTPVNPSFPVTPGDARAALDVAAAHPRRLQRPLVVIGGFADPGFAANSLADEFRRCTGDDRVIAVPLDFDISFVDYRRRIIQAVQAAFPSTDPAVTTEVDVVGYSMGGISARYSTESAQPGEVPRRLRIARLFTISSPLSGCVVTERVPLCPIVLTQFQIDLKAGSEFRRRMEADLDLTDVYPIYSYVSLGDRTVGACYAAVAGQTAWWVSQPILTSSHDTAYEDPRIRADIVRRLRGETPFSSDPPDAAAGGRTRIEDRGSKEKVFVEDMPSFSGNRSNQW